jgi:enoyl-CoA hydratase/carnithine racemase
MADAVLAERRGAVLLLTLNRPEEMNAWGPELEDAYFAHLDAADADPEVRVVVVTGAGRAFCVGVAFGDLDELRSGSSAVIDRPRPRDRPRLLRKPLIAALNGATAGLGLVEALYCDVRFCAVEAKLTTAFVRRGLIAEYGIAWMLPRLVGVGRANDLLLSGRVITGEEAAGYGLVDFAMPAGEVLDGALAYAADVAVNCSPESMSVIKGQLARAAESPFSSVFGDAETRLRESLERPDFAEGVASFLERREPKFAPLG